MILKCNDIKLAYLYYLQENRVATPDELVQFENMMYEIECLDSANIIYWLK